MRGTSLKTEIRSSDFIAKEATGAISRLKISLRPSKRPPTSPSHSSMLYVCRSILIFSGLSSSHILLNLYYVGLNFVGHDACDDGKVAPNSTASNSISLCCPSYIKSTSSTSTLLLMKASVQTGVFIVVQTAFSSEIVFILYLSYS